MRHQKTQNDRIFGLIQFCPWPTNLLDFLGVIFPWSESSPCKAWVLHIFFWVRSNSHLPQDAYKRLGSDIKKELNLKRVPWTFKEMNLSSKRHAEMTGSQGLKMKHLNIYGSWKSPLEKEHPFSKFHCCGSMLYFGASSLFLWMPHEVDPPYRVTFGDETFVDVDYDPMTPGSTTRYCWWFRIPAFTSWGCSFIPLFTGFFIHPRWLFGISEPPTVREKKRVTTIIPGRDSDRGGKSALNRQVGSRFCGSLGLGRNGATWRALNEVRFRWMCFFLCRTAFFLEPKSGQWYNMSHLLRTFLA